MTVKALFLLLVMWMPLAMPCHASWGDEEDDFYDYFTYDEWDEEEEYGEEDFGDYNDNGECIEGGTFPDVIVEGTDRSDDEFDEWWRNDSDNDTDNDSGDVENEQDSGLEEEEPERDNNETPAYPTAEQVIQELKSRTPELKNILETLQKENRIHIHNGDRTCYDESSRNLYIGKEATSDKVLHETIHYLQDECGKLNYDKNSINNEYETQWLVYLSVYLETGLSVGVALGIDEESVWNMREELEQYIDWNAKTIDDGLYDVIQKYAENHEMEFSNKLNSGDIENAYNHSFDSNYEYNWREMLKKIGH